MYNIERYEKEFTSYLNFCLGLPVDLLTDIKKSLQINIDSLLKYSDFNNMNYGEILYLENNYKIVQYVLNIKNESRIFDQDIILDMIYEKNEEYKKVIKIAKLYKSKLPNNSLANVMTYIKYFIDSLFIETNIGKLQQIILNNTQNIIFKIAFENQQKKTIIHVI